MIQLQMKDETLIDPARVKLDIVVEPLAANQRGQSKVYSWDDIRTLVLIEPEYATPDGRFGEGMPIRVLQLFDLSDLRVEVPLPLEVARELGLQLAAPKIQIAQSMPTGLLIAKRAAGA